MHKTYKPTSHILKKYIVSFNILQKPTTHQEFKFLAFPQSGTSIALLAYVNFNINDDEVIISSTKNKTPKILLLARYLKPIKIHYKEYLPEVSINFTPLGLNYFFDYNFKKQGNANFNTLSTKGWQSMITELLCLTSDTSKIEFLENFLLENLMDKNLKLLEQCVSLLEKNPMLKISEIANQVSMSQRQINRYFKIYIGCTPTQLKKILQFRKAIISKSNHPLKSLTEICFDTDFYDSSEFTREFKKLTNINPKNFFKSITLFGTDKHAFIVL